MGCSAPGSSVRGILQSRILEWLSCPPPGDLPDAGTKPTSLRSPALAGGFLPLVPPGKHHSQAWNNANLLVGVRCSPFGRLECHLFCRPSPLSGSGCGQNIPELGAALTLTPSPSCSFFMYTKDQGKLSVRCQSFSLPVPSLPDP